MHTPVLLREVLDVLQPKKGEAYLDLTAGYGGHAQAVLDVTRASGVLVDRDVHAVEHLQELFGDRVQIVHDTFVAACQQLEHAHGGQQFDMILADLGVSSPHLDNASRGFSVTDTGPLDMRMDDRQDLTAEHVVNTYPVEELARIIKTYGEEPKARRIAEMIVADRPIVDTAQLAHIAKMAWPGHSRTHPATRLFQAIRIEVNSELSLLEHMLPIALRLLKPGGRLAVISFHSLEDRIVKQFFREHGGDRYDAELAVPSNKFITAAQSELVHNPRARSAKMRVAQRK